MGPKEAGKLLAFLRMKFPKSVSQRALKRAIDAKCCRVGGKIETVSTRYLKAGDSVEIVLKRSEEKPPLHTLYEDEHFLAIDKPSGLLSSEEHIRAKLAQGKGELYLIHRLDKETSGVLLLAKTEAFLQQMVELFRKKGVKKEYATIVDGRVLEKRGACTSPVDQRSAHTEWQRLKVSKEASYLSLEPNTGRTHQIRIHMALMGHPILGDVAYGKKRFICSYRTTRNLLHAKSIAFTHPQTGVLVRITAPLPNDFKEALQALFGTPDGARYR